MVSVHYERVKFAFIIIAACVGQALADTLTDDYKKLTAISNQYLFETNDAAKADIAWMVQRNLETYEPAMLATMGLPGKSKKFFVFVEVPFINKVSYLGLDAIRVTVFDFWEGGRYTPMHQREFTMGSRSHVAGIQVEPPRQGLGEVLVIHAYYGGPERRPALGTTYWTLEAPQKTMPETSNWTLAANPPPLPVLRQISERGRDFEICFRRYASVGEAACYNPDGFSPEEWGRNVTNPCLSLRIRSLYELGCHYDFASHQDAPHARDLEQRMSEVRNSLLRGGIIGSLATNDPNPWVREHAQKLLGNSAHVRGEEEQLH